MEVVYMGAPTSLQGNNTQQLGKSIIFLSEDKIHYHQQVGAFELQAFETFKENKLWLWCTVIDQGRLLIY